MLNPVKLFTLLLPTLLLFCGLSWNWFEHTAVQREVFGNPDTFLDLQFPLHPPRARAYFQGALVTARGEEKISGVRVIAAGETKYEFSTLAGHFVGKLVPSQKGCEPQLIFRLEQKGKTVREGSLKAGFCSRI